VIPLYLDDALHQRTAPAQFFLELLEHAGPFDRVAREAPATGVVSSCARHIVRNVPPASNGDGGYPAAALSPAHGHDLAPASPRLDLHALLRRGLARVRVRIDRPPGGALLLQPL